MNDLVKFCYGMGAKQATQAPPMFDDDPFAKPAKPAVPLEMLSVEELEKRVERLKGEIAACEAMIAAKQSHKSAADAIFGRKTS